MLFIVTTNPGLEPFSKRIARPLVFVMPPLLKMKAPVVGAGIELDRLPTRDVKGIAGVDRQRIGADHVESGGARIARI